MHPSSSELDEVSIKANVCKITWYHNPEHHILSTYIEQILIFMKATVHIKFESHSALSNIQITGTSVRSP
jgi:hypothetical protein